MYQEKDIAWYEKNNNLLIHSTGDLEFEFLLPDNIIVNEMRLYVESYIPLSAKYIMNQNSPGQIDILSNKYEFYLYNVKTKAWDELEYDTNEGYILDTTIRDNASQYIGLGNVVRMKISVVELGRPEEEVYNSYYEEVITMPEIYIKGVSR